MRRHWEYLMFFRVHAAVPSHLYVDMHPLGSDENAARRSAGKRIESLIS
jgi:hypothetical protein